MPAVNVEAEAVTVTVPAAMSYATHVGPGYVAGEEPASMSVVVKVAVGGAAVAGEAVLTVTVPKVTVSEKPGAMPELPVKVSAAAVAIGLLVRYVPTVVEPLKAYPVGANTVIEVIAYAFVIGFVIFSVVPGVATPVTYAVIPAVKVGGLAFCAA